MSIFKRKIKDSSDKDKPTKAKAVKTVKPAKPKKEGKSTKITFTNDFIKASKEFENTRIDEIERSRKIAWRVAAASLITTVFACIAIVFLTPLKEVEPYLVRVDNNTGQTDIVTVLANAESDYGEEVTKFFTANYVRLVEGYDWYTIQNSFDKALLFSDSNVQNRLNNKFASSQAPHKVYKQNRRVEIDIDNITFLDSSLIQVRFTKRIVPTNGGVYDPRQNMIQPEPTESQAIATIAFDYVNVPSVDEVRLVNPLGYTVRSYRVDEVINQRESSISENVRPTSAALVTPNSETPAIVESF